MSYPYKRLEEAVIDGQTQNLYYRQTQLERLCKTLLENGDQIRKAIKADTRNIDSEVAVEFSLTISTIKRHYASLQPLKAHEEEYLIAQGKDAPDQREPAGIIFIEPISHTLFYSLLDPLSAAIASGNCVIALLENNLRETSSLLRKLLPTALDAGTFAIATSPYRENEIRSNKVLIVKQSEARITSPGGPMFIPSSWGLRVITVVDRTADMKLAARELVHARFAFSGTSPYAPDIVLVNEFVKGDFLQAVVAECVKYGSSVTMNGTESKASKSNKVQEKIDEFKSADSNSRVILQDNKFAVVDVRTRLAANSADQMKSAIIFDTKVDAPVLAVYSMSSLDNAIDVLNSRSREGPLASYYFSNPASAKYLSQFIESPVAFINHIPRELLLGPACPVAQVSDPRERYPTTLFSRPKPAFIRPTAESTVLAEALSSPDNAVARGLLAVATTPLKVMKRSEGGGVGFFEQGILISASLLLSSIVAVSGTSAWYLWRWSRGH